MPRCCKQNIPCGNLNPEILNPKPLNETLGAANETQLNPNYQLHPYYKLTQPLNEAPGDPNETHLVANSQINAKHPPGPLTPALDSPNP